MSDAAKADPSTKTKDNGGTAVAKGGAPASSAQTDSHQTWKPSFNPWLIAVSVTLAAFMEILDTTIVNVALPHIAGTLAASSDEATYALTSYLVANGIVLTVSGWLSDTIGRKRYFIGCLVMFTVCSFLCGIASSLGQLIVFRLMQGFFGGGLQPNQQAIILDTFPPAKRGAAFGLTAVATIVAPVLGPTLGGYITDTYTWRWIFFVNVPVGIFAVVINMILVEDPPWEKIKQKRKTKGIDYIGLALISLGLGCFQIMMDRGEDDNWLGSPFIRVLAILAFLGIFGAIAWLLVAKKPIVNLNVFKDKNFTMGCMLIAAMGMILYASSVVIPQFAQQELGYTATISGLILSPGGLVVIVLIPIVGQIMKRVQTRYIVMFGFFVMGSALYYSSGLVPNIDYNTLVLMRSAQTAALGFLFVPISQIAYLTLPMRLRSDGAAMFSMFRNVFGSIGISLSTAMITERTQANQAQLSKFMTPFHQPYNTYIADAERTLRSIGRAASSVHEAAVGQIYQTYMKQAAVLAYGNVFLYASAIAFLVVPFCLLISKKTASGGGGGH
jgi:DHA2 family multidrug resistance protein